MVSRWSKATDAAGRVSTASHHRCRDQEHEPGAVHPQKGVHTKHEALRALDLTASHQGGAAPVAARASQNPNMATRHMWSGEALRRGDLNVTWELLEDVYKCYGGRPPKRPKSLTRRPTRSTASSQVPVSSGLAATQPVPSGHGQVAKRDAAEDDDVDMAGGSDEYRAPTRSAMSVSRHPPAPHNSGRRSTRQRSGHAAATRGGDYMAAGAGAGSGALELEGRRGSKPRSPKAESRASTRKPKATKVVKPVALKHRLVGFGQGVAGLTEDDFVAVTESQIVAVRAWLQTMGLGVNRDEEEAFVLDNPICNGVLLCEVANIIVPEPVLKFVRKVKSLR